MLTTLVVKISIMMAQLQSSWFNLNPEGRLIGHTKLALIFWEQNNLGNVEIIKLDQCKISANRWLMATQRANFPTL